MEGVDLQLCPFLIQVAFRIDLLVFCLDPGLGDQIDFPKGIVPEIINGQAETYPARPSFFPVYF